MKTRRNERFFPRLYFDIEQARTAGHTRFMGTPCKHGHSGVRYVRDRQCVTCKSQVRREGYGLPPLDHRDADRLVDERELRLALKEVWE